MPCRTNIEHRVANQVPVSQFAAESPTSFNCFGLSRINVRLTMPELRYLIAQGPRHGTSHRACGVYPNRPAADPGISFS